MTIQTFDDSADSTPFDCFKKNLLYLRLGKRTKEEGLENWNTTIMMMESGLYVGNINHGYKNQQTVEYALFLESLGHDNLIWQKGYFSRRLWPE